MSGFLFPLITVTDEMMSEAEKTVELLKDCVGDKTTDYNCERDLIGCLGEQAFNVYLESIGLSDGLDYVFDRVSDHKFSGDCFDFCFSNGKTLDVKTSSYGYDLLVKKEAVDNRPCEYYVQAVVWNKVPKQVALVGFASKKQISRRKPVVLKSICYRVRERYLNHVGYFLRYRI